FFFQAEDGIRDFHVTGVQTCALPILIPLLLCCAPADAQIEHADGLWKLTTVAYQYYLNDPDTAISLTTQALETALSTQHRYYERSEERRVGKECRSRKRRQNATSTGR